MKMQKNINILITGGAGYVGSHLVMFLLSKPFLKIFAIDAVKIFGQKNITKLLMALDKGNYIRQLDNYKKLLPHFDFFIAKNRYLRFPYDHLISTKNIDKNIISDVFK